jgi:hypothetical protein
VSAGLFRRCKAAPGHNLWEGYDFRTSFRGEVKKRQCTRKVLDARVEILKIVTSPHALPAHINPLECDHLNWPRFGLFSS